MYGGFVERARAVSRLLSDERTSFLVVATPEPAPLREAEFFLRELASRRYEIGGLVLNRALPGSLSLAVTEVAADELGRDAASLAASAASDLDSTAPPPSASLGIAAHTTREWSVVARREAAARDRVANDAPVVVTVPSLDEEVGNLEGILTLAGILGDAA